MFKLSSTFCLLLVLLLVSFGDTGAQDGLIRYLRYDVNLTLQPDSGLSVEEIHQVALVRGATQYTRIIPTDQLVSISQVQILEIIEGKGRRGYQQAETPAEYTFQVTQTAEDEQTLVLTFPPNQAASTTFIIQYFVTGSLRFYEQGDQLNWRPFGWAAPAPVEVATVTMKFPVELPPEQLAQQSQGVATEKFFPDANRVAFRAVNVGSGDELEVSLRFPHGLISGAPASWQRWVDTLAFWTPILQGVSVILAFFILLLGPLGIYGWWYVQTHGKSALFKKVPKQLKTPPGNLSPAMAGVLLDGQARPRHITATLLDLANRQALYVYPEEELSPGDQKHQPNFGLYAGDQAKATASYEATLYAKIFGYMDARKRDLAAVRQALFMATPELEAQIELEAIKSGYLAEGAKVTRRQYTAFGGAGVLLSLVLGLLAGVIFSLFTYLVVCPFLSIAFVIGIFAVTGSLMPKRAAAGAQEASRWEAFRHYLENLTPKSAAKSPRQFAHLLPYAVTFGVEKNFIEKFAAAEAPTPAWWSIPAEKLPDTSHEDAYAWVSTSVMAQAQPKGEKQRTKTVIHRISTPHSPEMGHLLKDIKPGFLEFLHAAHDVFGKIFLPDEDQKPHPEMLEKFPEG